MHMPEGPQDQNTAVSSELVCTQNTQLFTCECSILTLDFTRQNYYSLSTQIQKGK